MIILVGPLPWVAVAQGILLVIRQSTDASDSDGKVNQVTCTWCNFPAVEIRSRVGLGKAGTWKSALDSSYLNFPIQQIDSYIVEY